MTDQCKLEIIDYVDKRGWFYDGYLFKSNTICPSYFFFSIKGKGEGLEKRWEYDPEKMDKYLLEFIGPILKKYNIKEINVFWNREYQSDTWEFNYIYRLKS